MSDKELLKRLRPLSWSDIDARFGVPMDETMREAADRIEQLGKACAEWANVSQSNYQRAKAAETKLAENEVRLSKAVEALQAFKAFDEMPTRYKRPDVFEVSVRRKLLSTLAEIENSEAVTLGEKT